MKPNYTADTPILSKTHSLYKSRVSADIEHLSCPFLSFYSFTDVPPPCISAAIGWAAARHLCTAAQFRVLPVNGEKEGGKKNKGLNKLKEPENSTMCHKWRGHYAWISQDINSCRKWNTTHNLAVNEPCSDAVICCTTRVAFYSSVGNGTDPWYLHLSFFSAYFTVQRFRVHNVSLGITAEFTWDMYAQEKKKVQWTAKIATNPYSLGQYKVLLQVWNNIG